MRTILRIDVGYGEVTADLTGAELETLVKILGKMQQVDERHMNGLDVLVTKLDGKGRAIKVGVDARVRGDMQVVTPSDYQTVVDAARKATIKEAVNKYLDSGLTDEEFIDAMYAHDVISYQQKKAGVTTEKHAESVCIYVAGEADTIMVYLDGTRA